MIRQLVKWKISGRFPSHPRNSIRENFNSIDNPRHQIFPKIISPKIFSGTSTKDLSTKRDERPVRDIPQMPHRTFHRIPASNPNVMQPTRNPSSYQPAPSSSTHPASALLGFIAGRCAGIRRVFAICRQALPAHIAPVFQKVLRNIPAMLCPDFFTAAGRLYKQNHLLMQGENDESGGLCESLS